MNITIDHITILRNPYVLWKLNLSTQRPHDVGLPRQKLNEYIQHYESVDYDQDAVHVQHTRWRRSTGFQSRSDQDLTIAFGALDQKFNLRLWRDLSAFSNDFIVEDSQGQLLAVDTSHIYRGKLADDPHSEVFGSVSDGVFEGKIISQAGTFYVENARRYFPNNTHHSVIYKEEDIMNDPYEDRKYCPMDGCGPTDEVAQWMERIQSSGENEEPRSSIAALQSILTNPVSEYSFPPTNFKDDSPNDFHNKKYLSGANTDEHSRSRRTASPSTKNTCSLYIRTDPTLSFHIKKGNPDHRNVNKKGKVIMKARKEIISLISHHVMALNNIYGDTKFDGKYEHRNIKFQVQRIKIEDDEFECNPQYTSDSRKFCVDDISDWDLLKLHTLDNYEDYCLAYLFTYRDFRNGIPGLSFLANTRKVGGICERSRTFTEKIGCMYQSTKHSLNTGIITLSSHNTTVPPLVSHLNLAHLIGHSFGSPNDYPPECRPGGEQGNFLMYRGPTSGDRPNNSRYSPCSIRNISEVLDAMHDGRKRNCFTDSDSSFCGNRIVEDGEECDCGYDDYECTDRCCYPRMVSEFDKERNNTAKGCSRKAYTQCSPSQGPCCDPLRCQLYSSQVNVTCREAAECSQASYCSGASAECPEPKAVVDHTTCNNDTQMCINGACSGSMCIAWNMTQCYLSSVTVKDKRSLCQLACQTGPGNCQSTADFAQNVGLPAGGVSLWPGSPCDNYQGYCDLSLDCRVAEEVEMKLQVTPY